MINPNLVCVWSVDRVTGEVIDTTMLRVGTLHQFESLCDAADDVSWECGRALLVMIV